MSNLFTPEELRILSIKYPADVLLPPLPSLDEIVVEFLRRHDVSVSPVSSKTGPSPLANAAMGAMGPAYVAANTHLTQQQKSAALQEWTSWKQWALSHREFPEFKAEVNQRYQHKKQRVDRFLSDNYDSLTEYLAQHASAVSDRNRIIIMVASRVAILALASCVAVFVASQIRARLRGVVAPVERPTAYP